ncbi:MAG: glycogen/starch synthase, partial [Candidatus Omnitrophica bacterium]|nr:glycogen/starch synthase [Candidatus Omnitrophota bacterium]
VSKFRVPMFRGTFNGAKYISPVSEKPKTEKKEYKPAPQVIPTPVAAAPTEKVQAPEPTKVIPKPEKQISSPVMPMTEQASQPEQVRELLSKDQAKFMLGYGFISKDELNQLLSDQRYSSYSHRDVLQKYFIEGMRAQAVAEWTQSSEYARTGERPLKGHTSVEGAIELWLERFIKDDFFRSRKKAIEEAANQYLPELDKTRAIFMAFGGFNERKEPLTEDEMVQFTGKSPVYIHHRKKIAVEIVRRAVATPTKEVLTSLLERLRKRLSVKRWYNREPQNQYAIEELDRILTELRPRVSDQIATAEPKEVQKLTLSVMDDSRLDSHLNLLAKAIENHNEESQKTELDYFLKITPSSSEELKTWLEKLMGKINFKNREQNQEAKNLAVLTILTELKSKLKPEDREDYSFLAKLTIEFLDFWGHYRGETTALLKNFFESIPESLLYESKELDLLTKLGELRLAVLSTLGDRNARSRLIEYLIDMYSEMVDRQIERFTVLYLFADLDTEELREAAQIGLQFAAEHWSPRNRNFVFQVYAFRWIEQAMLVRLKWMTGEIDIYDELQQIASGRKPYYQLPSPRKSEQIKGRAEVRYLENSSKQISIKAPLSPRSEAKRAEVHLTSVKSSTSQPPTKESRRAEVRVQISSEDIKDAFQWVGQEPYPFLVRAALMGIREGKMNDRIKAEAFARHLLGLQPDPEEKAHDFVIFLFSRVPLSQGSFEFLTQKGIEQIQFRHPRFLQSNDKFPVDPLTKRKLQALYQLMISPQATGQYEIVVDPQKSLAIVFEAKRAEVREKDSSEFKVSSLKLEKLETRNPKLETNFNRAEVRSIPVESSTLVPWAKESPRAEVRAARLEEDKRLLEGLGKNPVFYEETPDWQRVNVIGQIVLDKIHERPGPVKLEEILDTVRRKLEAQGINATVNVEALLNRLVDAGLIASRNGGYGLVVRREIFAVKVDHVRYIQDDFEKALEAISGSERHATIRLGRLVADYARVTSRWPLYPVESRWPVLRAVALMAPEKQKQLLEFFETEGSALWKFDLVDSIMLMLQPEPPRKWLSYHAPRLIGRTLYYISPETWLAAGGLGRVGQYHTIKIKELIGNDAQVATIEAYYPWTLNAEGKEEKADYGALPVPVEGLTSSPTMEFDVVVRGRTVKAQIFKGKNRFGIEVYLIKDTENFYTRLLYRYGSEFGSARWEEFSEFFSRASLELVRVLEEGKQASLKRDYKAPVLWANDGQLGPLPFFKRILDEHRDSLRNALVWMTTHTYPNRGFYYGNNRYDPIQGMKVPNDKWHYFEEKDPKTGEDRIDYTSAGVRNADGANGVSVVQRDEVAPLDPHIRLLAITNGDNREASSEVFRSILKELYPSADPEFPEPAQIMEVKKEAKRRLDLNPDQIVISYSGRLVPEKAGRKRAFDNDNIRALVEEGAQVVIYGNVQSHTKGMFEELVVLSHEVNQKGPGKLIVVTGWGIPEQRKLLAATDIQVQDSDRATGAAEYTEADISVNGGLQLGPPWLEGVIQRHGIILDRNVPGSGNTVIPVNKSKEAYLNALLWIVELFKQKREKLASYQATSIRLSRILDARLTAAEYLRQFHSALERKEDPVGTLEDHIAGKPVGQFFQSEWLRNDLINALQRSYAVSFDSTNSKLTAFVVESVGGIPGIISVETGVRTDGEKVWGEINNKKGEEEKAFGALLDFLQLEKPTDEVRVVDGVTREKYGSYPRDWFLNRGLLVGVKNFQVLHFEKGELPTALPKPTIADRASIFYSDATSNEIREVVQSLIPNGLFQNLAQKGFRKGNLIWWTPVEGFYPENLAPKSWLDQGFYLIVNKGEGHLVLTLTPTLTGYFDPGYRGRTFLTSGAFAHIALDVEGDTLWVRFGRMETFPEAEAENQEHYEDPAFRFWFLHNLKDFAEKYSFASIKIEQFNLSDNLLENLGFKRITERTVTQPAVWQFEVRPNKNHVFLSTTPRAEVRS